jgi:hypothetical protein
MCRFQSIIISCNEADPVQQLASEFEDISFSDSLAKSDIAQSLYIKLQQDSITKDGGLDPTIFSIDGVIPYAYLARS